MYTVDGHDRVIGLTDLPQCDVGSPRPALVATEWQTFLVYCLLDTLPYGDAE